MNRYLLFDPACSMCSRLARDIEGEAGGWLEARSLRDPEMRALLESCAGWKWEPMLVEVEGARTRVSTALALALRISFGVGPVRAFRILRMIQQHSRQKAPLEARTRRKFLHQTAALLGGIPLLKLPLIGGYAGCQSFNEGAGGTYEQVEGFLLLPDGEPLPRFVVPASKPGTGGCGGEKDGPGAATIAADSVTSLRALVAFPLYDLKDSSHGFRQAGGYVLKYGTGEVHGVAWGFGSESGEPEVAVSLWAQPDFPRPVPLWASDPVEPGGPSVVYARADFLPSPGVMAAVQDGYVFHWIAEHVHYRLNATFSTDLEVVKRALSELVRIG